MPDGANQSVSLQFDESTDITDTAQLCIFIRLVFSNFNSKEELTIIPMKSTTRGVDIYQAFINFVNKSNLPLYKLVCMRCKNNSSIALCKN